MSKSVSHSKRQQTLLLVEDESAIRDMIKFALRDTHFEILEADDAKSALLQASKARPDLILLDWMLPGKSGLDLIQDFRQQPHTKDVPIIMLTAKAEEMSKVRALELGADDYITKPFSPRELIARIKTILRRGPIIQAKEALHFKQLRINLQTHEVWINAHKLTLTHNEYRLLYFFITHLDQVFSRDNLLDSVWGQSKLVGPRTVDAQIKRLRAQLREFGYDTYLHTVRGLGYKFSRTTND